MIVRILNNGYPLDVVVERVEFYLDSDLPVIYLWKDIKKGVKINLYPKDKKNTILTIDQAK